MQTPIKTRGRVAWSSPPGDHLATLEPAHELAPRSGGASRDSGFLPYDLTQHDSLDLGASVLDVVALRRPQAVRPPAHQRPGVAHGHPARANAGTGRPGTPEEIRQAWSRWYALHPVQHAHARAAASLRVREVELLRALQGQQVLALQPDLDALLADVTRWGALVVEVHHPLGVAWLSLTPQQIRFERGCTLLHDGNRQIVLRGHACTDMFLIQTAGTCGLHLFDEHGEVVARIHLIQGSQSAEVAGAARQLMQLTRICDDTPGAGYPSTDRLTRPGWCAIERQIPAGEALHRLCARVTGTLETGPVMQLALEAPHAILACQATPVHHGGAQAPARLGARPCKLHFRAAAVRHAAVCLGPDGQPFLRFHALDGSCLRLQRGNGAQGDARAWIHQLLALN